MIPRLALLVVAVAVARVGRLADHRLPDPLADPTSAAFSAALVVVLVLVARPRTRPVTAAAVGFGLCAAFELLLLTGLPQAVGDRWPATAALLGTTFSALDLLWSAVGAALGAVAGALVLRAVSRPGARRARPSRD